MEMKTSVRKKFKINFFAFILGFSTEFTLIISTLTFILFIFLEKSNKKIKQYYSTLACMITGNILYFTNSQIYLQIKAKGAFLQGINNLEQFYALVNEYLQNLKVIVLHDLIYYILVIIILILVIKK